LNLRLQVLKLEDMISIEYAKFMFKFNNKMLPDSLTIASSNLKLFTLYNTRQKHRNKYFQSFIQSDAGSKTLHHICLKIWTDISPD